MGTFSKGREQNTRAEPIWVKKSKKDRQMCMYN